MGGGIRIGFSMLGFFGWWRFCWGVLLWPGGSLEPLSHVLLLGFHRGPKHPCNALKPHPHSAARSLVLLSPVARRILQGCIARTLNCLVYPKP